MTYIILAAGKGERLHPLTLAVPKSMYKLDKNTSVLKRMINLIKKYDKDSEIVVVTGFRSSEIERDCREVIFVKNPFYDVTNSIASLWFAKEYLLRDNVTVINADVVMEEKLVKELLCKEVNRPTIMLDSSVKVDGDYNAQVLQDKVLVMGKQLEEYYGEYAGVSKLDNNSAKQLFEEIDKMVNQQMYDQWYENALVQMIFNDDFDLFYMDICQYQWIEVDCVSDMLFAKKIHIKG